MALKQTPSQTLGPFFAFGLTARQYAYPGAQVWDGKAMVNALASAGTGFNRSTSGNTRSTKR